MQDDTLLPLREPRAWAQARVGRADDDVEYVAQPNRAILDQRHKLILIALSPCAREESKKTCAASLLPCHMFANRCSPACANCSTLFRCSRNAVAPLAVS